jgi:two-component system cell cycle sensor histidine kinase/response regulator CckA
MTRKPTYHELERRVLQLKEEAAKYAQAREELGTSEQKYRSILESIEEGYFEVDIAGNLTFFNDSLCKITGYVPDELMGMNNRDYTTRETGKRMYEVFNRVYRTGNPAQCSDFEIIRKDGNTTILEMSASLMQDSAGKPIGFRGIVRDVTERKRSLEEKKKLETQLYQAQKMEAIGTLAGGIAHDFNNILMAIQGNASLMLLDIDSGHPLYERAKHIQHYVQNASDLTKQLLGFARRGKYDGMPTNLNKLIETSSVMFGRTKKEITVQTKLHKDLWMVEVDQGQIEQVLLNLFINAWQAMPGGGSLHIDTENVTLDAHYLKPYTVKPGRYVKISITDTGVGMDKRTLERIFEPFFTTKELGRGTGLGLASVYGIIKNHEGYINVYSEIEKGTTFTIYLPASETAVVKEQVFADKLLHGTETLLLVDDEEIIIDVGKQMLDKMGYEVLLAGSGREAIEIYKDHQDRIDLVILDMVMPGMSGGETFERLREINPGQKVLLSSGYSINGRATEIMERGCDGFMQKPFNMIQLSQKIREILDNE